MVMEIAKVSIEVGNWVRRYRAGAKWHLVESVIDNDAITKCGRRMDYWADDSPRVAVESEPLTRMIGQPQNCRYCSR